MTTSISDFEKLLAQATPGPWASSGNTWVAIVKPVGHLGLYCSVLTDSPQAKENAALIVALVNTAPQLLAIAKAAQDADLNCSSLSLKDCGICPECRLMAAVGEMG